MPELIPENNQTDQAITSDNQSTIYIDNLGKETTSTQTKLLLKDFGMIVKVHKENFTNFALVPFASKEEALMAVRAMDGQFYQGKHLKVDMTQNSDLLITHKPEAEADSTATSSLSLSFEIVPKDKAKEISQDQTFENNRVKSPNENSNPTEQGEKVTINTKLQDFNQNSLSMYAMQEVRIKPYDIKNFLVKIDPSSKVVGIDIDYPINDKLILTSGLAPYPQLPDGVYQVNDSLFNITVKNNSNQEMVIEKYETIKGVTCHSWEFVRSMLAKNQDPAQQRHWNFSQWHLQTKTFKRINDWSDNMNTMESSNQYATTFNPWISE